MESPFPCPSPKNKPIKNNPPSRIKIKCRGPPPSTARAMRHIVYERARPQPPQVDRQGQPYYTRLPSPTARLMRRIAPYIVGLTLAVNLLRSCGQPGWGVATAPDHPNQPRSNDSIVSRCGPPRGY